MVSDVSPRRERLTIGLSRIEGVVYMANTPIPRERLSSSNKWVTQVLNRALD